MALTWAQLDTIERELWTETQRLQKLRNNNDALDQALAGPDPIAALSELATVDLVITKLREGLARLQSLKSDIRTREKTHERNLKIHTRL